MSPKKKKMKTSDPRTELNTSEKRKSLEPHSSKRIKTKPMECDDMPAMKRRNFVIACKQVSSEAYFDQRRRLQLIYLPQCAYEGTNCKHCVPTTGRPIKQMSNYAQELGQIELKTNMWTEALEVYILCINPKQYLSAIALRSIVEIILNAHPDEDGEYTIPYLIGKCQQILALNFSTHPPCFTKLLRKYYLDFLTSPMENKKESFSNRGQYECDKGVVKYCFNRLEHELSMASKDEPLLDKDENIPTDLKDGVRGLQWEKEMFDIYEMLERPQRIERLMAVLESVIELLQFDLVIWQSRYTNNQGLHLMRSHRPLMASLLWSGNVLLTGSVNSYCSQILKLYIYLIHLDYPSQFLHTMTTWVNIIIQTFYICESHSNSDYPNTGKYSIAFARKFYKLLSEMPNKTIIKVLEWLQPPFMRQIMGVLHLKELLNTNVDDVITILCDFLAKSQWKMFSESKIPEIKPLKIPVIKSKAKRVNIFSYLKKLLKEDVPCADPEEFSYPKYNPDINTHDDVDQNYVIHLLYITLDAYLESYNVRKVQDTLESLNKRIEEGATIEDYTPEAYYSVSEQFVKNYRVIFSKLQELMILMKKTKDLPGGMKIFENLLGD